MTIADGLAPPGMTAHINADRTVVGADAALNASHCLWHDVTVRQYNISFEVKMQGLSLKWHYLKVAVRLKK